MSKTMKIGKSMKKLLARIDHKTPLRMNVPAGMANPKPPLGSQLGQRNINIANFVKDFNLRTESMKQGIPIPCRVKVKADGTYDLVLHQPPASFFLKQAAGIEKGKIKDETVAGKITFKHLYEIAKIKSQDPPLALLTLQQICEMLVGVARTCGIQIVRTIDPKEHEEFMKLREEYVQKVKEEMEAAKDTKVLRTV